MIIQRAKAEYPQESTKRVSRSDSAPGPREMLRRGRALLLPRGPRPETGTSRLPHQNQNRAGTASPALSLRLGHLGRDPCPKVSLTQKAGQQGDNSREDRNTSRPAAALPARSSEAPGISVASPGQG